MDYATQDDLLLRMRQLEIEQLCSDLSAHDYLNEDGSVNWTDFNAAALADAGPFVSAALADAQSKIDMYLRRYGFVVPLQVLVGQTFPAEITRIACDIAAYRLFGLRQGSPKWWNAFYQDAIKDLESLEDGKESLKDVVQTMDSSLTPKFNSRPTLFSRETLAGI